MIIAPERIIFGSSRVLPGEGLAVLVTEGIIAAVAPLAQLIADYPAETVEQFPGATLLPGLIDLHVHLGYDGKVQGSDSEYLWTLSAARMMRAALDAGVTTVRDVGSRDGLAASVRRAAAAGYLKTPRIVTCNQGICMTGGHGADVSGIAAECDGEWEIRKAIRLQFREGADWIKILTSEGYRGEELTQHELDAAVDECHRMGRKCAAHAGYPPSVAMCIRAGFDTIEHGTYLTVEQAHYMAQNGQTWVSTIIAFASIAESYLAGGPGYGDATEYIVRAAEAYRDNFKKLYDTGVRVACGTDQMLPGSPVCPVAGECGYMVRYGITPLQAIECATKNAADTLGLGESLGQIRPGYCADLLLTDGDPAQDISALHRVRAVWREGVRVV